MAVVANDRSSTSPWTPFPLLLALTSWLGLALAVEPLAFTPLAFCALVPWLVIEFRSNSRSGFGRRFLLGETVFGATQLFWVNELVGWAGPAAWVLIFGLYTVFALPLLWILRRVTMHRRVWIWPLVFTGHDVLRQEIIGGISWHSLGYAFADWPAFLQSAEWGGVWALTFWAWFTNLALAMAILQRTTSPRRVPWPLLTSGITALLFWGHGTWRQSEVAESLRPGPLLVGLQANINQDEKLRRRPEEIEENFQRYMRLLAAASARRPEIDLIVWPETSYFPTLDDSTVGRRRGWSSDMLFHSRRPYGQHSAAWEFAAALKSTADLGRLPRHLIGVISRRDAPPGAYDEEGRGVETTNSVLYVEPRDEGRVGIIGRYDKRKLVPGGEYLPFRGLIPWRNALKAKIESLVGFIPCMTVGSGSGLLPLPTRDHNWLMSLNICFEMVYPDLFRAARRGGADFIVNLSNDAWYGTSAEMDLVHRHVRFRAVESRLSIFRVSNTGISTLVDAAGTEQAVVETAQGRKGVEGFLAERVPTGANLPLGVDCPLIIGWGITAAAAVACVVDRLRRHTT